MEDYTEVVRLMEEDATSEGAFVRKTEHRWTEVSGSERIMRIERRPLLQSFFGGLGAESFALLCDLLLSALANCS